MKQNVVLCGLLLVFMTIGCSPVPLLVGGGAAVTYKAAVDERSVGDLWSDAAITAKVKGKLAKDDVVHARLVDVDTLNGEVILTGVVETDQQVKRAGEVARRLPGVKRVRNELQVGKKTVGQSLDDILLGTRIKTHLFKEPWVRAFNIDVDVDRGVVTLTGIVDQVSRKNRVLDIARSMSGTVKVVDNLKVKND